LKAVWPCGVIKRLLEFMTSFPITSYCGVFIGHLAIPLEPEPLVILEWKKLGFMEELLLKGMTRAWCPQSHNKSQAFQPLHYPAFL